MAVVAAVKVEAVAAVKVEAVAVVPLVPGSEARCGGSSSSGGTPTTVPEHHPA